jgi:Uma2 family endonuclease
MMATVTIPSPSRPRADSEHDRGVISRGGGEWRVVFRGVDWETYSKLVDSCPEGSPLRLAFDGKDLEIMTKGRHHEIFKERLTQLVKEICIEFSIPYSSLGETTWKRPDVARGLEADQSFYFTAEKRALDSASLARKSNDVADYPNPDLAIEVNLSPSQVDRPSIYAALKVTEIWRFDGECLVIERLAPEGTYSAVDRSDFLPLDAQVIQRWLLDDDVFDELVWSQKLRAWIREELAPRVGPPK